MDSLTKLLKERIANALANDISRNISDYVDMYIEDKVDRFDVSDAVTEYLDEELSRVNIDIEDLITETAKEQIEYELS